MARHEVTITVDDDLEMTIAVKGLKGPACKEATRTLEELGTVISDTPTLEMNQREVQHERINHRG